MISREKGLVYPIPASVAFFVTDLPDQTAKREKILYESERGEAKSDKF